MKDKKTPAVQAQGHGEIISKDILAGTASLDSKTPQGIRNRLEGCIMRLQDLILSGDDPQYGRTGIIDSPNNLEIVCGNLIQILNEMQGVSQSLQKQVSLILHPLLKSGLYLFNLGIRLLVAGLHRCWEHRRGSVICLKLGDGVTKFASNLLGLLVRLFKRRAKIFRTVSYSFCPLPAAATIVPISSRVFAPCITVSKSIILPSVGCVFECRSSKPTGGGTLYGKRKT